MDSNDSSRRQRQAGLARGRQIRDRSQIDLRREVADRDDLGTIGAIGTAEAETATRRKPGCRILRQPLPFDVLTLGVNKT